MITKISEIFISKVLKHQDRNFCETAKISLIFPPFIKFQMYFIHIRFDAPYSGEIMKNVSKSSGVKCHTASL